MNDEWGNPTIAFTADMLAALKRRMPRVFNWLVVRPELHARVASEARRAQGIGTQIELAPGYPLLGGIEVIPKSGQAADIWAFHDRSKLDDYLAGKLTEDDLQLLADWCWYYGENDVEKINV